MARDGGALAAAGALVAVGALAVFALARPDELALPGELGKTSAERAHASRDETASIVSGGDEAASVSDAGGDTPSVLLVQSRTPSARVRVPAPAAAPRRAKASSFHGEVLRACSLADRLAVIDRAARELPPPEQALLIANLLDATPGETAEARSLRLLLIERLAPLADLAPARRELSALVELSTDRDERIVALRSLGRGPLPLSLEARASVEAASRSEDPIVAGEATSLMAFSDRLR